MRHEVIHPIMTGDGQVHLASVTKTVSSSNPRSAGYLGGRQQLATVRIVTTPNVMRLLWFYSISSFRVKVAGSPHPSILGGDDYGTCSSHYAHDSSVS